MAFRHLPHPAPQPAERRAELLENPGFGQVFTDHMVTIRFTRDKGWHDAQVGPRGPFLLDPAASVLHYAQEIFEGMKAYRTAGGEIALFRAGANAERFNASADRMAMPQIPPELFLQAVEELVRIDQAWVPGGESSLYLRPFMFADEAFLGVRPAQSYIFCVIASPVGSYFKGGVKPLRLFVSENYTRAAPGGTGAAKCGGNYAASLVAQSEASAKGCDQVVFLDAVERRWIEELGGMNLFFVFDDGSLVTPPLGGTILPGITRDSLIQLARAEGLNVVERRYSLDEWRADAASGRLTEAFACGTAAVVASIGEVIAASGDFRIDGAAAGQVASRLKSLLTDLQRGEPGDARKWVHAVPGTRA